jgi:hypothetical protein
MIKATLVDMFLWQIFYGVIGISKKVYQAQQNIAIFAIISILKFLGSFFGSLFFGSVSE